MDFRRKLSYLDFKRQLSRGLELSLGVHTQIVCSGSCKSEGVGNRSLTYGHWGNERNVVIQEAVFSRIPFQLPI